MAGCIAVLHGWSDDSETFEGLKAWLASAQGAPVADIWLGDYISMDDDVRIEDVAKRMEVVVRELIAAGKLKSPFDLIVHSTGGLVAREWIATFYPDGRDGKGAPCPVKRLIMLAPANFGSALAAKGKSMIGRLIKGLRNRFQTGTEMLESLELASAYTWDLAKRDLFDLGGDGRRAYGPDKVMPFVITGTRPYHDGVQQIVNEPGSDGTVRVAAANLNAVGISVDFVANPVTPIITTWPQRYDGAFPFAVLPDRDHSEIARPQETPEGASAATGAVLGRLILDALACPADRTAYDRIVAAWTAISEATAALSPRPGESEQASRNRVRQVLDDDAPDPESYQPHMQIVLRVLDDHRRPVDDYFVEFFSNPSERITKDSVLFHREVIEDVHVNSLDASRRCFFIDRHDLVHRFYREMPPAHRRVILDISAAPLGRNVAYFDKARKGASGKITVHSANDAEINAIGKERLRRNTTHFWEVAIPRQPIDKVFALKP